MSAQDLRNARPPQISLSFPPGFRMSPKGRQQTSAICSSRIIPRQKLIYATLPVTADDGSERGGQVGQRIDGVEFTGVNERGDSRPVLCSGIMTRNECVLPIEGNRADGPLDAILVDLDAAVGQEDTEPIPIFGDIGERFAERRLASDASTMPVEAVPQVRDQRS